MIVTPVFLRSVVWVNNFNFTYNKSSIFVLCVEHDQEVEYILELDGVSEFRFVESIKEEDPVFEVIESLSEENENGAMLRFISGTHLLQVRFTKCSIHPTSIDS